jgi:hypothetical protein
MSGDLTHIDGGRRPDLPQIGSRRRSCPLTAGVAAPPGRRDGDHCREDEGVDPCDKPCWLRQGHVRHQTVSVPESNTRYGSFIVPSTASSPRWCQVPAGGPTNTGTWRCWPRRKATSPGPLRTRPLARSVTLAVRTEPGQN